MISVFKQAVTGLALLLAVTISLPAAAVQDSPAADPAAVQFGDQEKAPAGSPDMQTLGEAMCTAGITADAQSLFNLFEPALFGAQMEQMKEFMQQMAAESGTPLEDPMETLITEFNEQMKETPLIECKMEKVEKIECSEETLQAYAGMKLVPDACGAMSMTAKLKNEESAITDSVPVVQINERWFIMPLM
jgi:hypothetical protein